MTTTTTIIDRLNATLATKTEAALADLAGLEQQITQAIAKATAAAQERIEERLANIDYAIGTAMLTFEDQLAEMAGLAVTRAVNHVAARLEMPPITSADEPGNAQAVFVERSREFAAVAYAARQEAEAIEATNPEPTPASDLVDDEYLARVIAAAFTPAPEPAQDTSEAGEPLEMPTPSVGLATSDEAGKVIPWRSQFEVQPTTEEPVAEAIPLPVAAHAVLADPVGILTPEDDEEDHDDNDGYPTTTEADGLHERTGDGRRTRYAPTSSYISGEVYYRKVNNRWQQVRYIG